MLKWRNDRADADGMPNSTPPPGYTPPSKPGREPNYLLRGVLVGAAVLALLGGLAATEIGDTGANPDTPAWIDDEPVYDEPTPTATPVGGCIVNGFGNTLCDDAAVAYCELLNENGGLNAGNRETCLSVGWVQK